MQELFQLPLLRTALLLAVPLCWPRLLGPLNAVWRLWIDVGVGCRRLCLLNAAFRPASKHVLSKHAGV
jgi:hypothetical protein